MDSLLGNTFDQWTVIDGPFMKQLKNYRRKSWLCKCSCGKESIVSETQLKRGKSKSCGHVRGQKLSQFNTNKKPINEFGNQYDKLTVIGKSPNSIHGRSFWLCQCDCGNTCYVSGKNLRSGKIKSCGCIKHPFGEEMISKLLENANIDFETEKTFKNCINNKTGRRYRFDFYIKSPQPYIIEFDGIQHFKEVGWGSKKHIRSEFERIKNSDKYKDNWCKENNIPIIRIPYYINSIQLEDLLLDKSKFIK